jgi:acetyl-CoA synthetase
VVLRAGYVGDEELYASVRDHVATVIGPIAKPKTLLFTEDLPKTRSGKIMRRLLRNVAQDETLGDTTTLADSAVVDQIKARYLAGGSSEE